MAIDGDIMESVKQVGSEPGECGVSDGNELQATEEDGVIDGITS